MNLENTEITTAMTLYFDGLYHSDVARLRQVFHAKAIYACATDGTLVYKTMDEYLAMVAVRESPVSRGETRIDEILSIEFVGPVTAQVRATCAIGPQRFIDVLTLIKLDGRWQIISKVFHYDMVG